MTGILDGIYALWAIHPIGQAIGLAASSCYILATLQHSDKRLFATQMMGAFLFVAHYAILGAWVGAFGYSIGVARNITAVAFLKKIKRPFLLSIIFFAAYSIMAAMTAQHWVEIIPSISGWLTAVAFYHLRGIRMRSLLLCAQVLFIFYAYYVGSIGGMLTASTEMIFTLFTISRLSRAATSLPQGI